MPIDINYNTNGWTHWDFVIFFIENSLHDDMDEADKREDSEEYNRLSYMLTLFFWWRNS